MSFKTFATALLAAPLVHGHYIFSQLIVNDQAIGSDYTYIRKNTNTYMPSFTQDVVNSPNLICNEGAQNAAAETYDVKAGDKIGFKLSFNEFIEHPGPAFVYMSKAPGDVASYDGTGDWFKAYENGVTGSASEDTNWGTWQKDRIEFTIPADVPDGEYLVRVSWICLLLFLRQSLTMAFLPSSQSTSPFMRLTSEKRNSTWNALSFVSPEAVVALPARWSRSLVSTVLRIQALPSTSGVVTSVSAHS